MATFSVITEAEARAAVDRPGKVQQRLAPYLAILDEAGQIQPGMLVKLTPDTEAGEDSKTVRRLLRQAARHAGKTLAKVTLDKDAGVVYFGLALVAKRRGRPRKVATEA